MMRLLISLSVDVRRGRWQVALSGLWLPALLVRYRSWKKSALCGFCVYVLLSVWGTNAVAATCNSTGGGTWNAIARWSCGHVPLAIDDVFVLNGHTVTIDTAAVAQNATVNTGGILRFATAAARSLAVGNAGAQGNVTVQTGATLDVDTASNVTHTLSLVGNFANSGTVNLATDANSLCNTSFNRNGNQTVSGAGAYTFNRITLNMGATNANILDMQSNLTAPANFLTITNGTYKHSNTSNITPWTADPAIPASGGFWLNAAATVTTTGFNVTLNGGSLRISAGTMTIGNADNTLLTLGNAATTLFQMDGGALTVTGGINSSSNAGAGTFTMSGGTITLQTIDAGPVYTFLLGSATTLNWSGGTIIATNGNATTDDVDIRSATQNITGGTLQLGSAATTSANDISYINGAGGQLNVWNLVLASGPARNILMRSSTNILNDLTIQTLNNLNPSAGLAINIGAGNASGNWTNNGTFTQGSTTVTFTGTSATPAIGGTAATTFNNLSINKASNNLTINTTPTVNGTLTFTNGDIVTGANRVILGTAATIATPSASSYVAGSIQKNYLAGAALSYFAGNDFPVGDATNFTPVNVSAGSTTTAGSLTVSTLTPDHPQVATPIASTGIDAAKSVNRYWRFNNTGLTVGTAVSATFTFVAGDVDAGATTANFIVQRYDGTNWNPTALVAANPLNTQASNITPLAAGNNDFAIGEPFTGFNGAAGAFNVFEASTPANAILGRIYTKIVGTAITLQVVAVNAARTGVNAAYNTNPITVDLLDARNNTGAITAATDCRSTWATVISTQSLSPIWTNGRSATITITAAANAWRDVRVRVTQGANVGCSTDRFSIRPTGFSSITSTMNNSGTSGAPSLKTGQNFTISALTGLTGYDNGLGATLASPQLIPLIDNTVGKLLGSPTAGTIGGSFGAASNGTATGATSFFYSEVGNFGLATNAVYDNVFTAVDQPGDCNNVPPNDFSNALVGGQYGCKFGSPAIALASGFGRFIPDNLNVSLNAPAFAPACGTFSYIGQPFTYSTAPIITVTARNGTNNGLTNATTVNYAGSYMKLTIASLTGKSYTSAGGSLDTTGVIAPDPAIRYNGDGIAVPPPPFAGLATLTFNSGTGLFFTRTTQVAPFNADIALAINVIDGDGVFYAGNPAAFGAATAGNGIAFSPATAKEMRFGRLALGNAFGSELLDLPIPMETQYYNSSGVYVTNVDDSCTSIVLNNVFLSSGTPTGGGAFVSGKGNLKITKPLSKVSIDLCIDLDGSTPTDNSCIASVPANKNYLQWKWSGLAFDKDPKARATFGVFKNAEEFIYLRENF